MRGTLTGGSVGLLRYPAMLPCFSRLWGMILHCRKSPCRLEIIADSRGLASGFHASGIIPAYAGNTVTVGESPDAWRDHPRVCGEHLRLSDLRRINPGSSPRVRGTRAVRAACGRAGGIIPAYAGNTPSCVFRQIEVDAFST